MYLHSLTRPSRPYDSSNFGSPLILQEVGEDRLSASVIFPCMRYQPMTDVSSADPNIYESSKVQYFISMM